MELRPDAVLAGTLRLVRPLGRGGMGVVWVARHLRLDTDVAVKLIRPDRVAANPALLRRFEREAKAAARIAHPNVVRVMDYGVVDDAVPYIVMELLAGFSLAELLERGGRLSLGTAKSLARQVGSALESAHAQGIVHRDIKPHNVFVTEGSREHALVIKVLDFGVAKVDAPGGAAGLTETGVVIGSAPYMSPEQLEGRSDVDLRADLWALAVVLYESLVGELPFRGGSFVTVGKAVLDGHYRPASELRPDLPPSIDDWFAKALCIDADGRFQTASEMVDAFVDLTEPSSGAPIIAPTELLRSEDVALATTEAARVLSSTADDDVTATHAPVAKKPPMDEPAPSRGARGSRRSVSMVLGALCVVAAGGAFVGLRATRGGGCPAGMVLVHAATFDMGTLAEADTPKDEEQHRTSVEAFCIDMTEVTVKAYSEHEAPPGTVKFAGLSSSGEKFQRQFCNTADKPDHPINCVDFDQARAYCASVGKRLPSEPEWELAARGTDGRLYPWGSEPPTEERLNVCGPECIRMLTEKREAIGKPPPSYGPMHSGDDGSAATAPVGSFPLGASAVGALDMAGNVWEWTESPYCDYGTQDCNDFRHVLRGGGWDTPEPSDVRAAKRLAAEPTYRARGIGFRCAKTP